jgi:hypothetical protein
LQSLKKKSQSKFIGEVLSEIDGIFGLSLVCGMIPAVYIYIMTRNKDKLVDVEFVKKYGSFYERIKVDTKLQLSYSFFFVVRRVLFCISIFAMNSATLQV